MEHSLKEIALPSGAKALLINVPGSKVINFQIGFLAGFNYANSDVRELPHVMEHTIFGANAKYKSMLDVGAEFEKNGAGHNAFTDDLLLAYLVEAALFEDIDILDLFLTCITTAKFLPEEVTSEIGNVSEELNNRISNHGNVAKDLLVEAMAAYRTDVAGLKSLPSINPENLLIYKKNTHTQSNLRFVLGGNLKNESKLIDTLTGQMSALPVGKRPQLLEAKPKHLAKPLMEKRDIPDIHYRFIQWFPEFKTESERVAAQMLNAILTWRMKSWIYGEARRRGLAYGMGSNVHREPGHHYFSWAGFVTPANSIEVYKLAATKLKDARAGKFTVTEVEEAKTYVLGTILRTYKTPGHLVDWYGEDFLLRDETSTMPNYLKLIENTKVEDVCAVAAKIFAKPLWGLSFVGKIDNKKAQELHTILASIWN